MQEEIEYKLGDESSNMFGPPDGVANLTNWGKCLFRVCIPLYLCMHPVHSTPNLPPNNTRRAGENWWGKNLHIHHPKTYEEVAGYVFARACLCAWLVQDSNGRLINHYFLTHATQNTHLTYTGWSGRCRGRA